MKRALRFLALLLSPSLMGLPALLVASALAGGGAAAADAAAGTAGATGTAGLGAAASSREAGRPRFAGTFLQLDGGNSAWSREEWEREFASMQRLGMNILIVQWAATPARVYYPSATMPGYQPSPSPLDTIIELAEKYGFSVYLGPYMNDAWWSQYMREEFIQQELATTEKVAAELVGLYGDSPAFAGWYLPYEVNATPLFTPAGRRRAAGMLRQAAGIFEKLTPGRPVTVSPFFDRWLPVGMFESWWKEVLNESGVDVVFLQDGVGTGRKISPELAGRYFEAMRRATAAAGVKLWSDLEIFVEGAWTPAPWDRIAAQLQAEAPHVEGFVVFEYNHYMSPVRGGAAVELYAAYEAYLGLAPEASTPGGT